MTLCTPCAHVLRIMIGNSDVIPNIILDPDIIFDAGDVAPNMASDPNWFDNARVA